MLDVASPSSQDVSNPAADNIAFASSAPSNLDQNADVTSGDSSTAISPTSLDAISNPAMADTLSDPSERSSLNAVQSNGLNPSDSSQLSQATNIGVPSINLDATAQYEAVVGPQPPNPASTLDVIQIPAGPSSGNGDLAPSILAVSSPANTLESNSNGAVDNIHLLSGLNSIHPGILSGNDGLIQAISSPVKVENTLSNLNIPQNGAVDIIHLLSSLDSTHPGILSGNEGLIQSISSPAKVGNTLANLAILQNGAVNNILPTSGLGSLRSTSPNIAETGTNPISFLAGSLRPVQATSLESNTVPTSNQIIASPETNTATTNGNCICNSF
jgi:hypothetical protein